MVHRVSSLNLRGELESGHHPPIGMPARFQPSMLTLALPDPMPEMLYILLLYLSYNYTHQHINDSRNMATHPAFDLLASLSEIFIIN